MKVILRKNLALLLTIPLLFLLVVSCSSSHKTVELTEGLSQDWDTRVHETIPEAERASKMKKLGHQLFDVANSIQLDVATFNKEVMALNENYDATHEQLQELIQKYSEQHNPKFNEYRDIIFAMRSNVSADEWKALTD